MKNLVFAALLLGGLSQATGCIIVSDDDSVESSTFLVTWNLESELQASPGAISCADAGVGTIRAISQPVGAGQIVDLFDCTDGTNETAPLPLDDYLVWVQALDAAETLVAESFSSEETLFDENPVGTTFTFPVDIGFFGLTWTLEDSGSAVTCSEVGGDGISVLSTEVGGSGTGYDEIFNCTDATATTTQALPIQDYTIVVSLLDDQDNVLGASDPRVEGIDHGNQLVDLGNFTFDFTP